MLSTIAVAAIALAGTAVAQNTATSVAAVDAAAATAKTESPHSNVKGAAFDRFVTIWLENTDFVTAAADPNLAYLASQGMVLSNYFGVTHPSEPNYCASHGGDNLGMDNDNFNQVAHNVSSVVELLADKKISWSVYQEDMPYSGFMGYSWVNQKTGANDYVRKHNPAVLYNENDYKPDGENHVNRLARMKNFTAFYEDLANDKLPQWMFITPNMTSDGHDTSVTVAGAFTRGFLEPLLTNPNFMKNTLVLITFDETETYTIPNRVFSILLGDALPSELVGTTDSNFYTHYSELSTVEANWGLHTLGKWDVGANVFNFVAQKTGDVLRSWPALTGPTPTRFLNQSFAGPFNSVVSNLGYPVPNTTMVRNGRSVLPRIVKKWGSPELQKRSYYYDTVEIPDGLNPPAGWAN